jgi:hypothetical protein
LIRGPNQQLTVGPYKPPGWLFIGVSRRQDGGMKVIRQHQHEGVFLFK